MLFLVMKMGREVELQLSASRMFLDIVLCFQKARLIEHLFFSWFPWFLVLTKSTPVVVSLVVDLVLQLIVGVQDEEAFYLDPHEVQPVVDIRRDNLEANTSSYHCDLQVSFDVVQHVPLESVDSSLAIGFYCRDKGLKLFLTMTFFFFFFFSLMNQRVLHSPKAANHYDMLSDTSQNHQDGSFDIVQGNNAKGRTQEDDYDWQLL
ncbi:Cysteine protease ATG4 [Camellia lanceoleosa]|uniref:Cysteine protease ATG4 n=1 Tax=Camellia lanceoleosa TaxID=1840588 RepID=A0ACC0I4X4_9ERIC|nr:Cysteine protease ATG4 [Camellia lanceoleosa]